MWAHLPAALLSAACSLTHVTGTSASVPQTISWNIHLYICCSCDRKSGSASKQSGLKGKANTDKCKVLIAISVWCQLQKPARQTHERLRSVVPVFESKGLCLWLCACVHLKNTLVHRNLSVAGNLPESDVRRICSFLLFCCSFNRFSYMVQTVNRSDRLFSNQCTFGRGPRFVRLEGDEAAGDATVFPKHMQLPHFTLGIG